ncbi:MAG: phage repressor protein/antirepressor Ant [Eggerthellaceae bacterium]|nr:phage repressor protein/antirepressor Ant [Eggerthellaceae bacterium]
MAQNIETFNHEQFGCIRVVNIGDEPWFVASDVAKALGYAKPNNAVSQHCKGALKRGTLPTTGGPQEFSLISEPDVFRLIVSSKLPSAQRFEAWVFEEVLPSIRRHGAYMTPERIEEALLNPDTIIRLATDLKAERERRETLEADNARHRAAIGRLRPKAEFAESTLDASGSYTVTEAARLLNQMRGCKMTRDRLFALLRADRMIEKRSRQATAVAIERGYLYNHVGRYIDPATMEERLREPYARLTSKGLSWCVDRYGGGQLRIGEGVA